MRQFPKGLVLCLWLVSILFPPALPKAVGSLVSLRFSGGPNHLLAQDVNDGNKGRNDLINSAAGLSGWAASGEGKLYVYDLKYGAHTFEQLDVRATEPSGSSL